MTILRLLEKEKHQEMEEMLRMIRLVSKKVQRGYDVETMAELFEKSPETIEAICVLIKENPGLDEWGWYDILVGKLRRVS